MDPTNLGARDLKAPNKNIFCFCFSDPLNHASKCPKDRYLAFVCNTKNLRQNIGRLLHILAKFHFNTIELQLDIIIIRK